MEELEMMDFLKNTCRTCAYQFGELYDIPDHKDISYIDFLEDFGNITVNYKDGQPCQLCSSCLEKLDISINFKLAIERANKILIDILQSEQMTVNYSRIKKDEKDCDIKEYSSSEDALYIDDEYNPNDYYSSEDESDKQRDKIKVEEKKVPTVSFLHRCRRCDTCFHTFDDLHKHSIQHPTLSPQQTLICRFCQHEFPHVRHLPIHIRKIHANDIAYKCGYCDKEFTEVKLMKGHIGVHMDSLQAASLNVTIPKKPVTRRKRRRRNSQNELVDIPFEVPKQTEDNAIIFCSVCRRFFSDLDALNKHMLDGHPPVLEVLPSGEGWIATDKTVIQPEKEEDRPYACRLCDKRFLTPSHMKRHEVAHDPEKPFACQFDLCRWKFPTSEELLLHEIVNHRGDENNVCPVCGKAHKHKRLLRQHMASHGNRQRYKCKHCQKGFNYKTHLLNHEASHTKEAQHLCQKCGKRFYIKDNFRQHVLRHNKKELPHACPHCPRRFLMPSQLRGHQKMHTSDTDFMCHTCGMQTKSSSQLHNHMQIHKETELKNRHCCNICMRYFKTQTPYEVHMRTHESGARIYKCDFCPWMFTSPQLLREHAGNRHSNKARKRKIGIFSGVHNSTSNDSIPAASKEPCLTNSEHSSPNPTNCGQNMPSMDADPTETNIQQAKDTNTEVIVVNPNLQQRIVSVSPAGNLEQVSTPHITIPILNSGQIYIVPTYYQQQENVNAD